MSIDQWLYAGPYLKTSIKKIEEKRRIMSCPKPTCVNHKKEMTTEFCSKCGSPIEEREISRETRFDIRDVLESEYHDVDMFLNVMDEDNSYVISNRSSIQGGKFFDRFETSEAEPPEDSWHCFERDDWKKVISLLEREGISFEKKVGVVKWCS